MISRDAKQKIDNLDMICGPQAAGACRKGPLPTRADVGRAEGLRLLSSLVRTASSPAALANILPSGFGPTSGLSIVRSIVNELPTHAVARPIFSPAKENPNLARTHTNVMKIVEKLADVPYAI